MTRRSNTSKQKKAASVRPQQQVNAAQQQKVPIGPASVTPYGFAHYIRILPLEGTSVSHSAIQKRIARHVAMNRTLSPEEKYFREMEDYYRGKSDPDAGVPLYDGSDEVAAQEMRKKAFHRVYPNMKGVAEPGVMQAMTIHPDMADAATHGDGRVE